MSISCNDTHVFTGVGSGEDYRLFARLLIRLIAFIDRLSISCASSKTAHWFRFKGHTIPRKSADERRRDLQYRVNCLEGSFDVATFSCRQFSDIDFLVRTRNLQWGLMPPTSFEYLASTDSNAMDIVSDINSSIDVPGLA
jgi:hypothetical protein